jgi:hypothetical protein
LNGDTYRLGVKQAIIVQILYRAHLLRNPWTKGSELLRAADSESVHLMDLFKGDKADIIESDNKGRYRLNILQR